MPAKTKRSTIYLQEDIYRALRLKAAEVDVPMSELVNDALRAAFREDAADLNAIQDRCSEPAVSFEAFVTELAASGKL